MSIENLLQLTLPFTASSASCFFSLLFTQWLHIAFWPSSSTSWKVPYSSRIWIYFFWCIMLLPVFLPQNRLFRETQTICYFQIFCTEDIIMYILSYPQSLHDFNHQYLLHTCHPIYCYYNKNHLDPQSFWVWCQNYSYFQSFLTFFPPTYMV